MNVHKNEGHKKACHLIKQRRLSHHASFYNLHRLFRPVHAAAWETKNEK
jgi:hypothetical protein